jgi:hypothetical protein
MGTNLTVDHAIVVVVVGFVLVGGVAAWGNLVGGYSDSMAQLVDSAKVSPYLCRWCVGAYFFGN